MQFGCIYFHIFIIIDKHFILSYLSSVSSTVHVTLTINHGYLLHTDVLRRSSLHDVAFRRLNSVFFMQGIYSYLQIDSTQGKQLLLNGIYFLIICTIFSICTKSEKMIKMQYFQEFFFFRMFNNTNPSNNFGQWFCGKKNVFTPVLIICDFLA